MGNINHYKIVVDLFLQEPFRFEAYAKNINEFLLTLLYTISNIDNKFLNISLDEPKKVHLDHYRNKYDIIIVNNDFEELGYIDITENKLSDYGDDS